MRYIFIIDKLNEQISNIVEQIQQNKANPQKHSAEKSLPLYERIHKKLTQIANLEAKLMEDALCYVQDKDGPCGKTLEPFCDKIYHSKDLTEDEIAKQILKQKAS